MEFDLNVIRARMAYSNITQSELAKRMGVHINTIQRKLSGKRNFTTKEITMLIDILDIKPKDLFKRS